MEDYATSSSIFRFLHVHKLGSYELWEQVIARKIAENDPTDGLSIEQVISEAPSTTKFLPLKFQFRILSSIPNFRHWFGVKEVKKMHYLMHHGLSPRNITLRLLLYQEDVHIGMRRMCFNDVQYVFRLVLGNAYVTSYQEFHYYVFKRNQVFKQKTNPKLSIPTLWTILDISKDQLKEFSNLYEEFKTAIVKDGTFLWRYHTLSKDIFLLNGYDSSTGTLQVSFGARGRGRPKSFLEIPFNFLKVFFTVFQ